MATLAYPAPAEDLVTEQTSESPHVSTPAATDDATGTLATAAGANT